MTLRLIQPNDCGLGARTSAVIPTSRTHARETSNHAPAASGANLRVQSGRKGKNMNSTAIHEPHPKNPTPASPRRKSDPTESSAVLPTRVFSPPQPSATSEEQLEEVNKELQRLAAATQLQT